MTFWRKFFCRTTKLSLAFVSVLRGIFVVRYGVYTVLNVTQNAVLIVDFLLKFNNGSNQKLKAELVGVD